MFKFLFISLFCFLSFLSFSQDPKLQDAITDKIVIGFPSLTTDQLNLIKDEFSKHGQIQQAYFVYGNHNVLMLRVTTGSSFKQVYDILKPLNEFYDINKCYVKPYSVFDFIEQNLGATPIYNLKS